MVAIYREKSPDGRHLQWLERRKVKFKRSRRTRWRSSIVDEKREIERDKEGKNLREEKKIRD